MRSTMHLALPLACTLALGVRPPGHGVAVPPPQYIYLPLQDPTALCLDGSRYGAWVCKAATNESWEFAIQGGGLCYTPQLCGARAETPLGSSKTWAGEHQQCLNDGVNYVLMLYCDGASFSGYREEPQPTGRGNQTVYFRGIRNLDATLALARDLGLSEARNVTVTGSSAGGITTFLHLDRVAAYVAAVAASGPRVRVVGKPVCGYFIASNSTFNAELGGVYAMQNASGSLSPECQAALAPDSWRCIIPSFAAAYVHTPFFALQSRFDLWQLGNGELNIPCMRSQPFSPPFHPSTCTPAEDAAIAAYGTTFMSFFSTLITAPSPGTRNGGFVDACIIHGSTNSTIDGLTGQAAFMAWAAGGPRQWWLMACNGSTTAGPCDTSPVCVPFP